MSEIVQIVGNTAAENAAYTGPSRELRAEISNWDLILHDGATAGGRRFLNQTNGDARWQRRNAEVEGIGPYNSEDRGILTRLTTGEYALRQVIGGSGITVTNGDGFSGNLTISLSDHIATDMTFEQDVVVEGVMQVDGGINADTSGTHTGDVVGNVTGNLTGNSTGTHTGPVTGALTGNSTGTHTGAVIGNVTGKADTADKWQTPRNLSITGDINYTIGFDGSSDVSGSATLSASGVVAGVYANPTVTVDAKGRITNAVNGPVIPGVPTGMILPWSTPTAPAGYLPCNGQTVNRASYPDLATVAASNGYALPYGPGNGTTTFTLPNLNIGATIYGIDLVGTQDPGRVFGSYQQDAFQGHWMSLVGTDSPSGFRVVGTGASFAGGGAGDNTAGGTHTYGPITDGVNGTPRTAAVTRAANVALLWVIKI